MQVIVPKVQRTAEVTDELFERSAGRRLFEAD